MPETYEDFIEQEWNEIREWKSMFFDSSLKAIGDYITGIDDLNGLFAKMKNLKKNMDDVEDSYDREFDEYSKNDGCSGDCSCKGDCEHSMADRDILDKFRENALAWSSALTAARETYNSIIPQLDSIDRKMRNSLYENAKSLTDFLTQQYEDEYANCKDPILKKYYRIFIDENQISNIVARELFVNASAELNANFKYIYDILESMIVNEYPMQDGEEKGPKHFPFEDPSFLQKCSCNNNFGNGEALASIALPDDIAPPHMVETKASPIIIDLDGDGVETTTTEGGSNFDHDGNRFAEKSGWAGADDALLVFDRDGNGQIDSGNELFGNNYTLANGKKAANGFDALKEFDSNGDGIVDKKDERWSELQLWQDKNGDGKVDDGELLTLEEAGVAGLNTRYTNQSKTDENGNKHLQAGSFIREDGTTGQMTDVWFQVDLADTVYLDEIAINCPSILGLPNLRGYGNIPSLHQAMTVTPEGFGINTRRCRTNSGNLTRSAILRFCARQRILGFRVRMRYVATDELDAVNPGPHSS